MPNKKAKKIGEEFDSSGHQKDTSKRVYQKPKIGFDLNIRERDDLTDKQKEFIKVILDKNTKVVFLKGPAGCSKTFISLYCGLTLLNQRRMGELFYIRSIAESASKSLGSLPGDADEKLAPFLMPLMDKLDEFIPKNQVGRLIEEGHIKGMPINYLRGASLNATVVIGDELQNFSTKEITTLITRIGEFSKFILCGDPTQSDINGHSGFNIFYDLFNDEESRANGIYCLEFTKDDIVRSGILRFIVEKIESRTSNNPQTWTPSFKI